MVEVVQVLAKSAPVPDVPLERPPFVWPPMDWRSRNSVYSTAVSCWDGSSVTDSTVELGQIIGQESGMEETPSSMSLPRVSAN
jgi:interleukin-1 receptor-associated kinase 1